MKMTENETTQPSISQLFRQLKEGGKALDVEKRIPESLLRRAGEELGWFCNCCGKELPESRRKQAIEDFVRWGVLLSIKPRARDTSWDDWVLGIFYQQTIGFWGYSISIQKTSLQASRALDPTYAALPVSGKNVSGNR